MVAQIKGPSKRKLIWLRKQLFLNLLAIRNACEPNISIYTRGSHFVSFFSNLQELQTLTNNKSRIMYCVYQGIFSNLYRIQTLANYKSRIMYCVYQGIFSNLHQIQTLTNNKSRIMYSVYRESKTA